MTDAVERHTRALAGFGRAVEAAEAFGGWDRPSPCEEWTARDVVEHVIGFHEVLLLRPAGVRAERPKDRARTADRWAATTTAIERALAGADATLLVPLTTDVLAHTWDLARAVGADDTLDPVLVEQAYEATAPQVEQLRGSALLADPVAVASDACVQDRLLALLGRRST